MELRRATTLLAAAVAGGAAVLVALPAAPATASDQDVFNSLVGAGFGAVSEQYLFDEHVRETGTARLPTWASGFEASGDSTVNGVTIMAATSCTSDCPDLEFYFVEENASGDSVITPALNASSPGYALVPTSAVPRTPVPDPLGVYLAPLTVTFPVPLPVQEGHRYFLRVQGVGPDEPMSTETNFGTAVGFTPVNGFAAQPSLSVPTRWSFPGCGQACLAMEVFSGAPRLLPQPVAVAVRGSQEYGDFGPTLTASATAPSGDKIAGLVSCTQVVTPTAAFRLNNTIFDQKPAVPAGKYVIDGLTCTGLGLSGPTAQQYQLVYVGQSFDVAPAPLTISAHDATRPYGFANPPFGYSIDGFVNGEDSTVVTGQPLLATAATVTSPPGSYDIAVDLSGVHAPNYALRAVPGSLTITRATPVITAPTIRKTPAFLSGRVRFTATVHNTTETGPPAIGVPVSFSVRSSLGTTMGCTAVTDASGIASCSNTNTQVLLFAKPRSYTITIPDNLQDYVGASVSRPITA
jgi:hypothetical protein